MFLIDRWIVLTFVERIVVHTPWGVLIRLKAPHFGAIFKNCLKLGECLSCNFLRCWYQFSTSEGLNLFHLQKESRPLWIKGVRICVTMAKSNTFYLKLYVWMGYALFGTENILQKMLYTICLRPSFNSCSFRLTFLNHRTIFKSCKNN